MDFYVKNNYDLTFNNAYRNICETMLVAFPVLNKVVSDAVDTYFQNKSIRKSKWV